MTGKNPLLHLIHHLLIGVVFILKGFDKFPHHNILGGLILCFGIIVLFYFIYMVFRRKEVERYIF